MANTDQQRLERIEQLVQQWRAGALPSENALTQIRNQAQGAAEEYVSFAEDAPIYDKGLG